MNAQIAGMVYLVGAGPGDPDLLTRRAVALLAIADIVLHDDLVPQPILDFASPSALIISVGKRCGAKRTTQAGINRLIVTSAQAGLTVVRLKSGDPLVFGRAAEEMDALDTAGISYTIVPGITAAFAAAAALQCSLTDRRSSSSIHFSTGHRAEHPGTGEQVAHQSPTRVIYMPGRSFAAIAMDWIAAGEALSLPCVVVSCLGRPEQSIQRTTLAELASVVPGLAPVLLLGGWAVAPKLTHDGGIASLAASHSKSDQFALHLHETD